MATISTIIRALSVRDVRFPTSLEADGSDAMHVDPDYSCAYVILYTNADLKGHGFVFTLGRGTEIVVQAIKSLSNLVVGKELNEIFNDFGAYWHSFINETQIRWLGPEKGVVHMAAGAIVNALWDLRAKMAQKPLWKLLVDMTPEQLVSNIDFTYISDVLTKEQAIELLKKNEPFKDTRQNEITSRGYPAYTTQVGWMGYPTDKIKKLCHDFLKRGFTSFKLKVGQNLEDDKRRAAVVREAIGNKNNLMVDANQRWDVTEAINWMKELAPFKPMWIEEPTSPDDVYGHAVIAKELNPLGIAVATGEHCQNRVMFKQFLQQGGLQVCQIDACRMGGVNEVLAVLLMAAKFNIPVCPHAGGVGLCELVQHYSFFDYICVTGTTDKRMLEYVDHLHEHFRDPVTMKNAHYLAPTAPGFNSAMHIGSLEDYEYPIGPKWKELFQTGKFKNPTIGVPDWIAH